MKNKNNFLQYTVIVLILIIAIAVMVVVLNQRTILTYEQNIVGEGVEQAADRAVQNFRREVGKFCFLNYCRSGFECSRWKCWASEGGQCWYNTDCITKICEQNRCIRTMVE